VARRPRAWGLAAQEAGEQAVHRLVATHRPRPGGVGQLLGDADRLVLDDAADLVRLGGQAVEDDGEDGVDHLPLHPADHVVDDAHHRRLPHRPGRQVRRQPGALLRDRAGGGAAPLVEPADQQAGPAAHRGRRQRQADGDRRGAGIVTPWE
jgi:hypothetical protein